MKNKKKRKDCVNCMGEHKTGVSERMKKRMQKKVLTIGVVCVLIAVVGLMVWRMSNKSNVNTDETMEPTIEVTEALVEATEPVELAETSVKIGEISDEGVEVAFDEWVEQTEFHVGDVMMDGNLKLIYMSSGEYPVDADVIDEGYKVVRFEFAVENMYKYDEDISFYNFKGYADDVSMVQYYGGENTLFGDLSSGRYEIGYVYLMVPADAEVVKLQYTATGDAQSESKIAFVYDGEVNCNYIGKTEIQTTENAWSVGDTADVGTFRISYLNCKEYISGDGEVQPADGYRFIRCEFKIERLTESEKVDVSSWDFSCYADDMPCEVKHIGDNNLNAVLHAGDSTQGTVTFEVPIDATIIEAEFLYDYWTTGRVVFNIKPVENDAVK